jgi:hypothetical protein
MVLRKFLIPRRPADQRSDGRLEGRRAAIQPL